MNIMLFSKICEQSGVGNHMRQLAECLVSHGHCVWVVSSTNKQDIENGDNLKFVLLPVTTKNPVRIFRNLFELHSLIKENYINIVHCHHRVASLYMRVYRMFWHVPVVYTLHSVPVPYDFWHRKLTYIGDRGIAVSIEIKDFMVDKLKIPASEIDVVQNGVFPPDFVGGGYSKKDILEEYNIPSEKYILLMNSRIAEVKNHLLMVEAVRNLSEENRNQIVVVCTGKKIGEYYERIIRKIEEYGLEEFFVFTGWVDTYKILSAADFLFLPSKAEGFPLSCVEAFLMSVPVARTKTGGYKDMEKICIPISSEDYQPIYKIIDTLIREGKEAFVQLTRDANKYAYEHFTIEKMTEKTLLIYEYVLGDKNKSLAERKK